MCLPPQSEDVKNSSGQAGETQVPLEGRTRSVRALGTAELIRPQKLKYFESMYNPVNIFSLFCVALYHKTAHLSCDTQLPKTISHCVSGHNDAEEESDEDEDYVPSEDWKKV